MVHFVLEPDWLGSLDWIGLVQAYLGAFGPESPVTLWLFVDPAHLTLEEAFGLLQPLLVPFGGEAFAAIELTSDRRDVEERAPRVVVPAQASWDVARFQAAARQA